MHQGCVRTPLRPLAAASMCCREATRTHAHMRDMQATSRTVRSMAATQCSVTASSGAFWGEEGGRWLPFCRDAKYLFLFNTCNDGTCWVKCLLTGSVARLHPLAPTGREWHPPTRATSCTTCTTTRLTMAGSWCACDPWESADRVPNDTGGGQRRSGCAQALNCPSLPRPLPRICSCSQ